MDDKSHAQNKPYLLTRELDPENQETPIHFLNESITPAEYIYRRNHHSYPNLSEVTYTLPIQGSVYYPIHFTYDEIRHLPSKTIKVVMECSGNKRSLFDPKVFGVQWEDGAISQDYWTGVPLQTFFQYTGLRQSANEVVFEAHDFGERKDSKEYYRFARSLPLEKALHPDTLIAYELNGKPIPLKHGYPYRLIVPHWYAMASVKWVKSIVVIDQTFKGPFQTMDYVYYPEKDSDVGRFPVTTININSTILQPLNLSKIKQGDQWIQGMAWTGKGTIEKVEVSLDQGQTWHSARFNQSFSAYEWVKWSFHWLADREGIYTIWSRATDSHGRTQPIKAFWNRKGYGYNAVCKVSVKVE